MSAQIEAVWQQFICRACGLIYDERLGDPDSGLAAGTRFEDIPDDWLCPLCGVTKADFELHVVAREPANRPTAKVRLTDKPIIIIGGGTAGWSMAQELRDADPDIELMIVSECQADRYHKPALSLAAGNQASRSSLVLETGADAARRLNLRLVSNTFAIGIDAHRKRLRTTRGTFSYRALILAIGARAIERKSLPAEWVWRVNHLDAWSALRRRLQGSAKRVLMIGAGLVGVEIADDLAHAGHQVTVLEPAGRPLSQWASPEQSQLLLDRWQQRGIRFFGGIKVTSTSLMETRLLDSNVAGAGSTLMIRTECGQEFEADLAIAATGLATDPRLARSASLDFDQGFSVNPQTLETNSVGIFGLGDCISINGKPCRFIEPIRTQARTIARQLIGSPDRINYEHRPPIIRMKARSLPLTLANS